jgi:hypothetical protein
MSSFNNKLSDGERVSCLAVINKLSDEKES